MATYLKVLDLYDRNDSFLCLLFIDEVTSLFFLTRPNFMGGTPTEKVVEAAFLESSSFKSDL